MRCLCQVRCNDTQVNEAHNGSRREICLLESVRTRANKANDYLSFKFCISGIPKRPWWWPSIWTYKVHMKVKELGQWQYFSNLCVNTSNPLGTQMFPVGLITCTTRQRDKKNTRPSAGCFRLGGLKKKTPRPKVRALTIHNIKGGVPRRP